MNIDPVTAAGLVTREIRTGRRGEAPTKLAIARRTYATDQADLWNALTDADRIARWFLPISGNLEVGGRYQLEGNAAGVVERCDQPESFAVTWEFGGMVSWLEVRLTAEGDGTTVELVHEAPVDPDLWGQFGPSAVGIGWDLGLLGLDLHLSTGAQVDPQRAAAFATSPEGVRFVQLAAAGWAGAAAIDGDEPAQAHEAATRTVALYTTAPESTSGS